MRAARGTLLTGIAIAAVCVGASPALAGSSSTRETVSIAMPEGETGAGPRGIVVARQLGRSLRLRVNLSLQGGKANTTYRVVASPRPCSRTVAATSPAVWRMWVEFDDEGNAYGVRLTTRRRSLGSVRSVRVYEREQDAEVFTQRACGVVSGTYDTGTGILT
jgi:hypothetical protein